MLSDPKLEARARAMSQELRCLVCQNELIDDSEAPLAHDLRVLVRQRIEAGDSDAQVMNFIVARYGEFVLLKPRLEWRTAVLWGTPPGLLLIGIVMLLIAARRRQGVRRRRCDGESDRGRGSARRGTFARRASVTGLAD